MKRRGGYRKGTRNLLRKRKRERGKINISRIIKEFKEGEKVIVKLEPSYHFAMPHPRFHGKVGEITGKQGECYYVKIKDGRKIKYLLSHPLHLKVQKNN